MEYKSLLLVAVSSMTLVVSGTNEARDVLFEPDAGAALQTAALQATIDRAAAAGGGRIVIPKGKWTTGSLFFKPGTSLKVDEGAILYGSTNRLDYKEMIVRVEGLMQPGRASLINAVGVNGFKIEGPGVIDGQGRWFWKNPDDPRPRLVHVANSTNVVIRDVTLRYSAMWHLHIYRCKNVLVENATILSPTGIHSDAVDLDIAENVVVRGCKMNVYNDAVSLKGGKGPDANDFVKHPENGVIRNVLVENCEFGGSCFSGVTLGSECLFASNVVLRNSTFKDTTSALYLKMRIDTPQLYQDVVATNLSGTADCALWVRPYLQHAKPEWKGLSIPSVATNILCDAGPAFVAKKKPEVIIPHKVYKLYRKQKLGMRRS